MEIGINLKQYYPSVEWDILGVPAERHEKYYPCCAEPYPGKWTPYFIDLKSTLRDPASISNLFRYILQHNASEKDSFLYCELDHPLCRHLVLVRSGILPPGGLRGENRFVHLDTPVADDVLPPDIGNHPFDVARPASPRQIPPLHHGTRRTFRSNHDRRPQRALPETEHA